MLFPIIWSSQKTGENLDDCSGPVALMNRGYHQSKNSPNSSESRYTSLDYALMEEHIEVAQYMIEQGGLSITGIQDIAALKIQVILWQCMLLILMQSYITLA